MRLFGRISRGIARVEAIGAVDNEIETGEVPRGGLRGKRSSKRMVRTCGFSRAMASAALCVFNSPIVPVSWITCRWRLESETRSSSAIPSVPTPAAAILQHRRTEAAGADHQNPRRLQFLLPGAAHFGQQDVALVTGDFV